MLYNEMILTGLFRSYVCVWPSISHSPLTYCMYDQPSAVQMPLRKRVLVCMSSRISSVCNHCPLSRWIIGRFHLVIWNRAFVWLCCDWASHISHQLVFKSRPPPSLTCLSVSNSLAIPFYLYRSSQSFISSPISLSAPSLDFSPPLASLLSSRDISRSLTRCLRL